LLRHRGPYIFNMEDALKHSWLTVSSPVKT
jgi:hypothetical protein